jgi:hypothetical protein
MGTRNEKRRALTVVESASRRAGRPFGRSSLMKTLREYLVGLRKGAGGKDPQVREALEIYIGLWETALEKGIVAEEDGMDMALSKVEAMGGLQQAVQDDL